jgi:uncharacterized protein
VHALLSLWMYHPKLHSQETEEESQPQSTEYRFLIGNATPQSCLLCQKWICQSYSRWTLVPRRDCGDTSSNASWFDARPETYTPSDVGHNGLKLASTSGEPESSNIIAYRYPSTEPIRIFGQHIFSRFMRAVAENIYFIPGNTILSSSEDSPQCVVTHPFVKKLVTHFTDQILGTEEEALLCIIPNLAAYGKLPEILHKTSESEASVGLKELLRRNTSKALVRGLIELAKSTGDTEIRLVLEESLNELFVAAGFGDIKTVKTLLARSDMDIQDTQEDRVTVLHMAVYAGSPDIVQELLDLDSQGVAVSKQDKYGRTALDWAKLYRRQEVLEVLSARFGSEGVDTGPELYQAVVRGDVESVRRLLKAGADVEGINLNSGETALRRAVTQGDSRLFLLLVQAGGDIEGRNKDGVTPLLSAVRQGNKEMVTLLLQAGADVDVNDTRMGVLSVAAQAGDSELVRLFASAGADVNERNSYSETPLKFAAEKGHTKVVQQLVEYGADIDTKDRFSATPLSLAARAGYGEVVDYFVDHGANIEVQDDNGVTPLGSAAYAGQLAVVRSLVQKGADINVRDRYGRTALRFAAQAGYLGVVQYLVKQGADINATDRYGRTSLRLAAGNPDAVDWLRKQGAT